MPRTRPDIPYFYYHGTTSVFFAYSDDTDLSYLNESFQVSQFEDGRQAWTIERQLRGNVRTFGEGGTMSTAKGFFVDDSTADQKVVTLSGFFGMIDYIAVGRDGDSLSWEGLDTGGINYLWACLVEGDRLTDFRSSRARGDWEPISTLTPTQPVDGASLLLATYTSGGGIDDEPADGFVMPTVASHANTSTNPHGASVVQTTMSGETLEVLESYSTLAGVPEHHVAAIQANSGVTYDGLDFSETAQFIDGSTISERTHLHALTSGLQYVGAAPSELLVSEVVAGAGAVAYDQHGGHNVIVLSGVDAVTRTHFRLLVPPDYRLAESLTFVHGQAGSSAVLAVQMQDTDGTVLDLALDVQSGWPTTSVVVVPAGVFDEGQPFEVQAVLSGAVDDVLYFGPWALKYHAANS